MKRIYKLLIALCVCAAVIVAASALWPRAARDDSSFHNYAAGHYAQQVGGKTYYFSGNGLFVVDAESGSGAELIRTEEFEDADVYPSRLWHHDGKLLYLSGPDGCSARSLDLSTGEVEWLGFKAFRTFFVRDGIAYYMGTLDSELHRFDLDAGKEREPFDLTAVPHHIAPTEQDIVYICPEENVIRAVDYDGDAVDLELYTEGAADRVAANERYICWHTETGLFLYERESRSVGRVTLATDALFLAVCGDTILHSDGGGVYSYNIDRRTDGCRHDDAAYLERVGEMYLARMPDGNMYTLGISD